MAKDLTIKFDSEEAARHFALWLCESGEQEYWEWMRVRESEEPGDITAVSFGYHGEEDESLPDDDPKRYGEFLCDGIIRTKLGRVSDE